MQWEAYERAIARIGWQMSAGDRPSAYRQDTENPALSDANLSIPVTPTVSHEENQAYVPPSGRTYGITTSPAQHVLEAIGADGVKETSDATDRRRSSPSAAAAGARDGEELLRRLSLTGQPAKPDLADVDPQAAHPSLSLSGNVISAAFCVPYKIGYTNTGEWVRLTCYD